jgi:hypothetical protein
MQKITEKDREKKRVFLSSFVVLLVETGTKGKGELAFQFSKVIGYWKLN